MNPIGDDEFAAAALREVLVKYSLIATFTVLLHDYLITFPREVRLIWGARWNFAKMIYLVARYTSFAITVPLVVRFIHWPNQPLCFGLNVFTIWTSWLSYASGEVIFSLRTCAIWYWSRGIILLMTAMYVISMSSQFAIDYLITESIYNAAVHIGLAGCYLGGENPAFTYISLSCLLAFETVVGCLTFIKAFYHLTGIRVSRAPLLVTLYRDGLLFYVYTATISLANILVVALAPGALLGLIFSLQRVLHSILSVRVMLHLREVHEDTGSGEVGMSVATFAGVGAGVAPVLAYECEI